MNDHPEGFQDAVDRLETIVARLESDDADLDVMAADVAAASELIRSLRARITATEMQLEELLGTLDAPADDGTDEDHPPVG